ncbi:hypothetical protein NDU88_002153 [Pleurodeles waltl]|uniref:Uncharacterized protein n=1 Tax=Pleurodeles waltl TaxID=8319 RepID=A0AAV7U903_PLEWA|nr:hypothetical protein NDU88_002153 [Pleurodeles waltl]
MDVTPTDTATSGDRLPGGAVIKWVRNYFWVILILCIVLVSAIISIIMVCVCRTQLYRGFSQRFSKSFTVRRKHEGKQHALTSENSIYHVSGNGPPPSSRDLVKVEDEQCYSYVQHDNLFEIERYTNNSANRPNSGYIGVLPDGDSDYDDAIIPPSILY